MERFVVSEKQRVTEKVTSVLETVSNIEASFQSEGQILYDRCTHNVRWPLKKDK